MKKKEKLWQLLHFLLVLLFLLLKEIEGFICYSVGIVQFSPNIPHFQCDFYGVSKIVKNNDAIFQLVEIA